MMHRERSESVAEERIVADDGAGVVFDPSWVPGFDRHWFEPAYWQEQKALRALHGGRGGVFIVDTAVGKGVLRHYRRGGSVARLLNDRFLWTGRARTRSLMEYRLLSQLHSAGLPVPRPIGGGWVRSGTFYRADLMTQCLVGAQPLSAVLDAVGDQIDVAARVGTCVGRFHARGVFHADLNAHNILIDEVGTISLIDFDRGRILPPQAAWQQANLRRLLRSLMKLHAGGDDPQHWQQHWWAALLQGHAQGLEST